METPERRRGRRSPLVSSSSFQRSFILAWAVALSPAANTTYTGPGGEGKGAADLWWLQATGDICHGGGGIWLCLKAGQAKLPWRKLWVELNFNLIFICFQQPIMWQQFSKFCHWLEECFENICFTNSSNNEKPIVYLSRGCPLSTFTDLICSPFPQQFQRNGVDL